MNALSMIRFKQNCILNKKGRHRNIEYIVLVWDIINDNELLNLSTQHLKEYFHGLRSRSGYIFLKDKYINLDTGVMNYFFQQKNESVFSDTLKQKCG